MTRAKQMKSVFRMITPYLKTNDIPMVGINHTYDEIGGVGAPKKIVSGGQGAYYSADTIFVVGRRQIKEGKEITGWTFVLNVEKSRFVKEKAAIPFDVMFDGGISKYSGLLDVALITGHVETPKKGWYTRPSIEEDKNWRRKESNCDEFWEPILADESFHEAVKKLYSLDSGKMFSEDLIEALGATVEEIDYETGEILTD